MKICLYSPYLIDHFGGGERYLLSVAEYLSRSKSVQIAVPEDVFPTIDLKQIRDKYERFFQLNLSDVEFVPSPIGTSASFFRKLWWTRQFDAMYYLTDGSLFFSLARRNVLHIQFPFSSRKTGVIDRLKLRNWKVKNTNSAFTKSVIERNWQTSIDVIHHPYVDTTIFSPAKRKQSIILHVGRFFSHLHSKRQDLLVKVFCHLVDQHPETMRGWRLVLIGGIEDEVYAKKVRTLAAGYPIEILHDASIDTLRSYYSVASIYWHATGYDIDEYQHPLQVEHFGISTLEAMASGAIPIVINKGGQKELVDHGLNGYLWNQREALEERTLACVSKQVDASVLREAARKKAKQFSAYEFAKGLHQMLGIDSQVWLEPGHHVSAIIPTYNGKNLLEKHLPSVLQALRDQDELVVIDDASRDDTLEYMIKEYNLKEKTDRATFSERTYYGKKQTKQKTINICLIVNNQNLRYAASCNVAVKFASHDLVFLLNNDVRPEKDVLSHLVPYFFSRHGHKSFSLFAVGCQERSQEADRVQLSGKSRLWFERGLFVHARARNQYSGETAWVAGGSGLFDKRKWLELGGFDTRFYPAYWEDIDLCYRAQMRGWGVQFEAKAHVQHHHETTNATVFGQDNLQQMSYKNGLLFTFLHAKGVRFLSFVFWLPYHLIFTTKRSGGRFLWGFVSFSKQQLGLTSI